MLTEYEYRIFQLKIDIFAPVYDFLQIFRIYQIKYDFLLFSIIE